MTVTVTVTVTGSEVAGVAALAGPAPTGPVQALAQLQRLISGLNPGLDLEQTLSAVVQSVVSGLGFGVAVVSVDRKSVV